MKLGQPLMFEPFCGQGGATKGYQRAGFKVVGLDAVDHSARYPFPGYFAEGDALEALRCLIWGDYILAQRVDEDTPRKFYLDDFDAIHASPPCQGYSIATAGNLAAREKYERLIAPTRDLLEQTGRPWVIENVEKARDEMRDPVLLCGRMFGLGAVDEDGQRVVLDRHRLFESNIPLAAPEHPAHGAEQVAGIYGGSRRAAVKKGQLKAAYLAVLDKYAARVERGGGYVPRSKRVKQELLGIDWMTVNGMEESIPPAYAQYIGYQLRAHIEAECVCTEDVRNATGCLCGAA